MIVHRVMRVGPRPDWDSFYMSLAFTYAARASCARRAVGCILTDVDNRIIVAGYNGTDAGSVNCTDAPCPGADTAPTGSLHTCRAVHAEVNAVKSLQGTQALRVHTAYVTSCPCEDCILNALSHTTCSRIVYAEPYPNVGPRMQEWIDAGGTLVHLDNFIPHLPAMKPEMHQRYINQIKGAQ